MDFRDFFDKKTKVQFSILLFLIEKGGSVKKEEIKEQLNISTFILERSYEELNDLMTQLRLNMHIHYYKKTSSYKINDYHQQDLETLYYEFIRGSLFYKLIWYLYNNTTYTVPILCQELAISEATVYRNINHANKLLAEFKLVIKNGKIHGDDLQWCHFYFQFFWNSMSQTEIEQFVCDQDILRFTDLLEKRIDIHLTPITRLRISLWCQTLKVSSSRNKTLSKTAFQLLNSFRLDPVFQLVKETYFISLSYSAVFGSDYSAAYIYLFLLSSFPYAMDVRYELSADGWPTYLADVVDLNELVLEQIDLALSLESKSNQMFNDFYSRFLLSQTHSKLLYLKGKIIDYNNETFFKHLRHKLVKTSEQSLIDRLIQTTEKVIGQHFDYYDKLYLSWVYSYVIMHILEHKRPISIGVHLSKTPLLSMIYIDQLQRTYKQFENISIDIADESKHYDILIADTDACQYSFSFDHFFYTNQVDQINLLPIQEILHADTRKEIPCEL